MRENFVGFADAALVDTAEQLYVRESRHIAGEYQLTLDDVLENRWFDDTIAIGSYPVDVPPNARQLRGIILGNPDRYGVPFRCLVPQRIDGLLVVGRSASYTSLAAGSARVIPLGMAEGDAAGVAAAYVKEHGQSFREISQDGTAIAAIQQTLKAQGAYLEPWEPIQETVEQHWAYKGVKTLRSLGLVYGEYQNDYRLDEPITKAELTEMVTGLWQYYRNGSVLPFEVRPTCQGVLDAAMRIMNLDSEERLTDVILTAELQPYFANENKTPNRAEVIMLLANVHDFLQPTISSIAVPLTEYERNANQNNAIER